MHLQNYIVKKIVAFSKFSDTFIKNVLTVQKLPIHVNINLGGGI